MKPDALFAHTDLHAFCRDVFEHHGVPRVDAEQAAAVLVHADLRGVDSHGVARLLAYHGMLASGRIDPRPRIEVVRESASTATVDGGNGLGLVVGPAANRIALAKARTAGSGWVTVRNTNHFGAASYYVLEALAHDVIGWSMTNSTKLVAPHRGAERMLGTNPIAIAFPGHEEPPIVVDMASCTAAYGKVEIARRRGREIPRGWAIDASGNDTTSPDAMVEGGALLPLGSDDEGSGHKGYALAVMVDVLSAVLSGANWGPFAPPFTIQQEVPKRSVGRGIGHFFGAMSIAAFDDPLEFKRRIDDFARTLRGTRSRPGHGPVLVPGDPEREAEAQRRVAGVPLVDAVVRDLASVAEGTGVALPAPLG